MEFKVYYDALTKAQQEVSDSQHFLFFIKAVLQRHMITRRKNWYVYLVRVLLLLTLFYQVAKNMWTKDVYSGTMY